jgi:hypothetical protein
MEEREACSRRLRPGRWGSGMPTLRPATRAPDSSRRFSPSVRSEHNAVIGGHRGFTEPH